MKDKIIILSYNILYKIFNIQQNTEYCIQNNNNICIQNTESILLSSNFDIIALQEIATYHFEQFSESFKSYMNNTYNIYFTDIPSYKYTKKYNIYKLLKLYPSTLSFEHNEICAGIITLVHKKFKSKLLSAGIFTNYVKKNYAKLSYKIMHGRPYQLLLINDFIFINLHAPHIPKTNSNTNLNTYNYNKLYFKILRKLILIFQYKLKTKKIIISGDFNTNLSSFMNLNKLNNNYNTCCHHGTYSNKFNYCIDHIFTSFNKIKFKVLDINKYKYNNIYYTSDHKPIIASVEYK